MARWSPGSVVVVLGAGATRGAEFVGSPAQRSCLPPLNGDFFTQLQRIATTRHRKVVDDVIGDVVDLFGPNFQLTLEDYFTQLEAMLAMSKVAGRSPSQYSRSRLAAMRQRLLSALSAVLEESADVVRQNSPGADKPCSYHRELIENLKARETIISFNYDCVVDHALRTHAKGKWSARYGYGFSERVDGAVNTWDADDPPGHNQSINLLKLHGSLNWFPFEKGAPIRLRERLHKQHGEPKYEIVPPEFAKSIDRPIFRKLWGNADLALRKAKTLIFVGFSFTPTDLHVQALFRMAMAANAESQLLKRVIIANPDKGHRYRIREIVTPVLLKRSEVVQFDTFADLALRIAQLILR